MYVLGISCFYHDAAACLLRDGEIVAAVEEERFTRRKHDLSFPINAIRYCLREAGIAPTEVDHVIFYEKPLLKFERTQHLRRDLSPLPRRVRPRDGRVVPRQAVDALAHPIAREATRPHLVRGASPFSRCAYLVSPFDEAAVLTADAVGEWTTTSIGVGHGTSLELLKEIRFPHSLGLLYSTFTAYLGFEVNESEYKVMGMAAYGKPRYVDEVRRLIDVAEDGSFQLNMRYFEYHRALRMFGSRFIELFGPSRVSDAPLEERHADIAASVQQVLEDVLLRIALRLRRETGMPKLCMAGGVALNGLANTRILKEAGFDEIFIQPAAGDAGGSVGAAAYLYHTVLGGARGSPMGHAYLGPGYSNAEIEGFLARHGIPATRLSDEELVEQVAWLFERDHVVGWFRGRMEFGPRALGARSILASPRNPQMQEILNTKIKHRESFRPLAPAVTLEDAPSYFDLSCDSPYMLHIPRVRPEKRGEIPAVTHVDGTARVQTVSRVTNPVYYDLIRAFERAPASPCS